MPYDLDRLQADIAQVQHEAAGFGTGRLVAENLILTSAHVLYDKERGTGPELDGWQVRLAQDRSAGAWPFRSGNRVVWHDRARDLALIRILNPEDGPLRPELRFRVAAVLRNNPHIVEARGYPRASKQVEGPRDLTPALGRLTAADPDRPLRFGIDACDLPNDPRGGWPGMSGSAVLLRDTPDPQTIWVYGVVREVPANFNGQLHVARLADVWRQDEEFRRLLLAAGAPDEDAEDPSDRLKTPENAKLDEILAMLRASGTVQRAADQGISEAAVRAIVVRLGGEGLGREDLIPWLDNWIEAARRELGRRTNEGEAFEAARREAERRFKEGRLADASSAFMEEFEREEKAERERQEERKRQRRRLLEEAIRFDELAFNGEAAAQKLRLMAEIDGVSGSDALGEWLFDKAAEFYERGDQKGDNAALLVAIALYRAALEERTRERVPLDWAMTQMNLGIALWTLGERESGTARLEEAVTAYRTALEEWTRERVPLRWARTQMNLGTALATLGERESGTARLEEAVTAYRTALEEWTRERVPLDWARTQMNLGTALQALGERESGTARLEEAVAAYRTALEEWTPQATPHWHQITQQNLTDVLAEIERRRR